MPIYCMTQQLWFFECRLVLFVFFFFLWYWNWELWNGIKNVDLIKTLFKAKQTIVIYIVINANRREIKLLVIVIRFWSYQPACMFETEYCYSALISVVNIMHTVHVMGNCWMTFCTSQNTVSRNALRSFFWTCWLEC